MATHGICSLISSQWGAVLNAVLIIFGNISGQILSIMQLKPMEKPVAINCCFANGGTVEAEEFSFPRCDPILFSTFR